MENKSSAFIRLAESRVNKAIYALNNIGKLSNKNNYEYDDDQVKQIMTALKKAVQDTEANFTKHKRSNSEFRFRK